MNHQVFKSTSLEHRKVIENDMKFLYTGQHVKLAKSTRGKEHDIWITLGGQIKYLFETHPELYDASNKTRFPFSVY